MAYRVPAETSRSEIIVVNSRFITTVGRVDTTDGVKRLLKRLRAEMPDASHHVYAFRVGYGNSVIEGMSDDGEPSGTAGPPVLAVLRGTDVGDTSVVVTRYFGGTKLGTGGLVRAYTEAAQVGLANTRFEEKIKKILLGVEVPYSFYETLKMLIVKHNGHIEDETFAADVTVIAHFPESLVPSFAAALAEASAGRAQPIVLED
jgi:uncharacterized YigZ family protein